ncbi:IclR family transcriptional regulator [Advenella kashmirensis W13003]|uniref:IclR family transcriptional regulator n=1 Tax=Advenella kashmirensis W13003 TaxID=1424334 RepID=V8QXT4_9BURK|nr:IclR family transcriptional regulator [Advenella kashmirensis]ETF04457.1 IclR family transcriptional regulator [Advenella kashmirensis W13003]
MSATSESGRPPGPPADRQIVNALVRGLALLACFRVERPLLTNADLSRLAEMPRSSVSRLTHTLVKEGYLEYDSRHRAYRLAVKVLSLGRAMLGGMLLRNIAMPAMQELANDSDSQVAIVTCEDTSMLIIEVATSAAMQAYPMEVGARMAVDMTAMGRVYLASCSSSERARIVGHLLDDGRRDARQLQAIVDASIAEFHQQGFCTSIHSWRSGVNGVAVPLYVKDLGRRLILTCGGDATQLTEKLIYSTVAPRLKTMAQDIESVSERLS